MTVGEQDCKISGLHECMKNPEILQSYTPALISNSLRLLLHRQPAAPLRTSAGQHFASVATLHPRQESVGSQPPAPFELSEHCAEEAKRRMRRKQGMRREQRWRIPVFVSRIRPRSPAPLRSCSPTAPGGTGSRPDGSGTPAHADSPLPQRPGRPYRARRACRRSARRG